jgi:Cell division protein anillin
VLLVLNKLINEMELIFPDIFTRKIETSSDTYSGSPKGNSSNGYPNKQTTSTSDNNAVVYHLSSSNEPKSTPSTGNSSGQLNLRPTIHSTAKKKSKVLFTLSANEILNDKEHIVPEIVQVFTDLDLFIDRELNELETRKRIAQKLSEQKKFQAESEIFKKLKDEYSRDKIQHQKDFDKQLKYEVKTPSVIEENDEFEFEDENEMEKSFLDLTISSQMNRLRLKKMKKMKEESIKQEYLLAKINGVLERILNIDDGNLEMLVSIERHYLVASNRFQAALTELRTLTENLEPFHPRPFNLKGKCVVSDIMLEIKPSYFERLERSHNEFIVVLLKYDDQVFASKPICITNDIRVLKFPHKFRIPEAYVDFEMRLEVHGTTFWRQRNSIRKTMLKKYGFVTFTLSDSGQKLKRMEMIEVIKSENNPMRTKVLMKIKQKITSDVFFEGNLMVKLGENWFESRSVLCGNLIEINFVEQDATLLLDLYDFDNDFVIANVQSMTHQPFAFLLKFNHYVAANDFQ